MSLTRNVWQYDESIDAAADLIGYDVDAADGSIGKIDAASGPNLLVVDTGFWIFSKKRLIPAGVVGCVDHEQKRVHVAMWKDQIRHAPDFDHRQRGGFDTN